MNTNKKIGMLTFHQCHNVGAMLGAYALQKTIKNIGYDAEFINNISATYIEHGKKASHNLYRRTDERGVSLRECHRAELEGRWRRFESFYRTQLELSPEIEKEDDIRRQLEKYGILLVGGDQLWNKNLEVSGDIYYIPYDNDAFRISFGTSMGNATDIDQDNLKWLRKFKYIGVREKTAASYIASVTGQEAKVVPDNTFLLDKKDWKKITVSSENKNYIFAYIFCRDYEIFEKQIREIDMISKEMRKTAIVCATDVWEGSYDFVSVIDMGPMEWLGYIADADFVITNSFHGVAFSIAFDKQFICLDSDQRKENLLTEYNLSDRLSRIPSDYAKLAEIDYRRINEQISEKRRDAILSLTTTINACYE